MMEERRKLSASIAHDLRTPITVMKGYTEYLSYNVPLGRISEGKLLDTIHNLSLATDRLSSMQTRCASTSDRCHTRETNSLPSAGIFCGAGGRVHRLTQQHQLQFSMDIGGVPDIQVMLDGYTYIYYL